MTTTANYGWTKPTIGGDSGSWGGELNTSLDNIDTTVKAVSTVANAALPLAGGTMTGLVNTTTETFKITAKGAINSAQSLDASIAQAFTLTMSGALQLSIINVPALAGTGFAVLLWITNGNSAALTWPSGIKWAGGIQPVLSTAGLDIVVLLTYDHGTSWHGVLAAKNVV